MTGRTPEDTGMPARGRRNFLAWSAFALFSAILGRRRTPKGMPGGETLLPGREARYYRKVGRKSGRDRTR